MNDHKYIAKNDFLAALFLGELTRTRLFSLFAFASQKSPLPYILAFICEYLVKETSREAVPIVLDYFIGLLRDSCYFNFPYIDYGFTTSYSPGPGNRLLF